MDKKPTKAVAPLLTATENPLPSPIFSIPYQSQAQYMFLTPKIDLQKTKGKTNPFLFYFNTKTTFPSSNTKT